MLSNQEIRTLNKWIDNMKIGFFQLVSDFGPGYIGVYRISFEEMKEISNRTRITKELISDYINYISFYGFNITENEIGLHLILTSRSLVGSQNDALRLAEAIKLFRDRAALNGDIDNM